MLRKYESDPSHIVDYEPINLREYWTYVEVLIQILVWKEQVLRKK